MFSTTGRIPLACATASIPSPSNSKRISPFIPAGGSAGRTLGWIVGTTRTGRWIESGDGVRFFPPARSGFGAWRGLELNKVRFFRLNAGCPTGVLAKPPQSCTWRVCRRFDRSTQPQDSWLGELSSARGEQTRALQPFGHPNQGFLRQNWG